MKSIVGERRGRLIVISEYYVSCRYGKSNHLCSRLMCECKCDCGSITTVSRNDLGKHTNSCGCLSAEAVAARSVSRARLIVHDGLSMSSRQWSKATGISARTIRDRIRNGWAASDAITIRPSSRNAGKKGCKDRHGRYSSRADT